MAPQKISMAAELDHVRDVSILGDADYDFWRDRLAHEGLVPIEENAKAKILMFGAEGRFNGILFRELAITVLVRSPKDQAGDRSDASILLQAFNSRRFFAFCERAFFKTPYDHGNVELSIEPQVTLGLRIDGRTLLETRIDVPVRDEPWSNASPAEECWNGPIFLPAIAGKAIPGTRLFFGHIHGATRVFRLKDDTPVVKIAPNSGVATFDELLESQFRPRTILVRSDATHAKSKTYSRSILGV